MRISKYQTVELTLTIIWFSVGPFWIASFTLQLLTLPFTKDSLTALSSAFVCSPRMTSWLRHRLRLNKDRLEKRNMFHNCNQMTKENTHVCKWLLLVDHFTPTRKTSSSQVYPTSFKPLEMSNKLFQTTRNVKKMQFKSKWRLNYDQEKPLHAKMRFYMNRLKWWVTISHQSRSEDIRTVDTTLSLSFDSSLKIGTNSDL